jgi:8-oxo-dGTP diphosphatase
VIRVAAGVAVSAGRALVCRRAPGRAQAGKWEFPGGKLEPGESWQEALRRELGEELGSRVTVGTELRRTEHRYPAALERVEVRFFAIVEMRGDLDERHFSEVRWQPLERLAELDFLAADRDFVAALAAGELVLGTDTRLREG